MKALTKNALLTIAAGLAAAVTVSAAGDISVFVNGEPLEFDVPPIIENERTLVPMRAIFEALGAKVSWDGDTATVTAKKGEDTLSITIGSNILYKNGAATELDVPAKIVDERTLVPVRAVSESFDAEVDWNGEEQSVLITTAKQPEPTETPTAAPDGQPFDTLTEADMASLKEMTQYVRYNFEQINFPRYILGGNIKYDDLLLSTDEDSKAFMAMVYSMWENNAAAFILDIEDESDTVYIYDLPGESIEEKNKYLVTGFHKILTAAGMDGDATFREIGSVESDAGTRLAVIEFKNADTMVDCKYIGIAATKDGKVRYFTAENDIMQTDMWCFCEVTNDYRGTISAFKKTDADTELKSFAGLCQKACEENLEPVSRMERKLN